METPLEITFRHMDPSPAVAARLRQETDGLQRFFDRLIACRVVIQAPDQHRQHGGRYHVGIVLSVPGNDIVVDHEPSMHGACSQITSSISRKDEAQPEHKDVYVAIGDAFAAARRQLQDHVRRLRGDVKSRTNALETL